MSETEYKPEIQTDCFGWDKKNNNCSICSEAICKYKKCTHYKSKEQFLKDRKKYPFVQ